MDKNNIWFIYRLIWKHRIKETNSMYHNRFRYDDELNVTIKHRFYDDDKPQCRRYILNFRYNNYPWHRRYICSFKKMCCASHDETRGLKTPLGDEAFISKNYNNFLTYQFY